MRYIKIPVQCTSFIGISTSNRPAILQPRPAISSQRTPAGRIIKRQLFIGKHVAPAAIGAFVQESLRPALKELPSSRRIQFALAFHLGK